MCLVFITITWSPQSPAKRSKVTVMLEIIRPSTVFYQRDKNVETDLNYQWLHKTAAHFLVQLILIFQKIMNIMVYTIFYEEIVRTQLTYFLSWSSAAIMCPKPPSMHFFIKHCINLKNPCCVWNNLKSQSIRNYCLVYHDVIFHIFQLQMHLVFFRHLPVHYQNKWWMCININSSVLVVA